MKRFVLAGFVLLILTLNAAVSGISAASQTERATLNLQERIGDIQVVQGDEGLVVEQNGRIYSAEQYLGLIEAQQAKRDAGGPVFRVLNITTAVGVLWVGLGLLGQLLFTGRMVVQWLVSEKYGQSIVPPVFWWLSLTGATMLLAYFIWRKDIVGILGQGTGWAIYARNVFLIRRAKGGAVALVDQSAEAEAGSTSTTLGH